MSFDRIDDRISDRIEIEKRKKQTKKNARSAGVSLRQKTALYLTERLCAEIALVNRQ